MKQSNFKSLPNEPCLYYRQYQGTLNLISLYVDDLVIAGTIDAVESVKAIMLGKYKMKDLKRCHFSFPVFLKKPVSVHNLRNNNGYVANTILFGYSKHRGTLLCRFSRISHAGS